MVDPSKSGRNCANRLIIERKFGSEKELTSESELKKIGQFVTKLLTETIKFSKQFILVSLLTKNFFSSI